MLLETLDVRNNDVVIFSENKLDLENNFKIIFKQGVSRKPLKLSFNELCEFIKDPSPKNLIVYRLLTNIKDLDPYASKYGYFISNNGNLELFYFDPVFIVKDLKYITKNLDPKKFRFKIQQVGLTTMTAQQEELGFSEVFKIDMKAIEAKNQNDKIFADAIFIFDETYDEDEAYLQQNVPSFGAEEVHNESYDNLDLIQEDLKTSSYSKEIDKIEIPYKGNNKPNNNVENLDKKENKRVFADFIKKHKVEIEESKILDELGSNSDDESGLDLFNRKNLNKKRVLREDSVILKFNDD